MSEENQRLTLGEVQKEDLKFQPALPQDELTSYFQDTDIHTIMDDFEKTELSLIQRLEYLRDGDLT